MADWLRLLAAAIFFFSAMIAIFLAAASLWPQMPFFLITPLLVFSTFVILIFSAVAFNWPAKNQYSTDVTRLEADGLLESRSYTVEGVFQVEEVEDEGLHFFLKLADGSTLYLSGQYLYDYAEPFNSEGETLPPRFPCTHFAIRRHRLEGYAVDLLCEGEVLAPVMVVGVESFERLGISWDLIEDGEILRDRSYASLLEKLR